MKPASFDYYCPDALDEALRLLGEYGHEGKLLAGGQSLVPILNMRLSTPECLIDINRLASLDSIRLEDGWLKIGALTRQRKVEQSALVAQHAPLLSEAVPFIGHMQTRNRGTVGGSLVHADPTAELPLSLLALGAVVVIQSTGGKREVSLEEFFVTYLTTDVAPDELVTEVKIPTDPTTNGFSFQEYSHRHGDFAMVDSGCALRVDSHQRITSARLVMGGVDAVPVLVDTVDDLLRGEKLTKALLAEVGQIVCDNVDPQGDLHGSREYRLHLARVFSQRVLSAAYLRATRKEELA